MKPALKIHKLCVLLKKAIVKILKLYSNKTNITIIEIIAVKSCYSLVLLISNSYINKKERERHLPGYCQ
jgi:hypothetical protein